MNKNNHDKPILLPGGTEKQHAKSSVLLFPPEECFWSHGIPNRQPTASCHPRFIPHLNVLNAIVLPSAVITVGSRLLLSVCGPLYNNHIAWTFSSAMSRSNCGMLG